MVIPATEYQNCALSNSRRRGLQWIDFNRVKGTASAGGRIIRPYFFFETGGSIFTRNEEEPVAGSTSFRRPVDDEIVSELRLGSVFVT